MWIGFWVNALTGTILLAVNATKLTHNPDFYVKLVFIALAVINIFLLKKHALIEEEGTSPSTAARILAVTSLIFWLGAIISGRLLAYVGRSVVF
jgi:MFS-type transporter involved in bile tolerance (Atg22 family)